MKKTAIKYALHKQDESPIFGEDTIHITADDEGGGAYAIIQIVNPSDPEFVGNGKVTLTSDELSEILKIVEEFEGMELI